MKANPVKDEDEIDDDEDRTLKIDEGPLTNLTQIAQEANWNWMHFYKTLLINGI